MTPTPPGELIPTRGRRSRLDECEPGFPVTPMLDMAFQLLAFFLLASQFSSPESRIDLVLPAGSPTTPAAATAEPGPVPTHPLKPDPGPAEVASREPNPATLLEIIARSSTGGRLNSLEMAGATLDSPETLTKRLQRLRRLLDGRVLRVRLVMDDDLLYSEAAALITAVRNAGVNSIRLAGPPPRR